MARRKTKSSHEVRPKILIWDIEVSPRTVYCWRLGEQYVSPDQMITDNFIISIAWQWYYTGESGVIYLTPKEVLARDDKRILTKFYQIAAQADFYVYHNGDSFDLKEFTTRLIKSKLPPLPPVKSFDTLKLARRYFKFHSNKMDEICRALKIGQKLHTGMELWIACVKGNAKALKKMSLYNIRDVEINAKLFTKLLPFIKLGVRLRQPLVDKDKVGSEINKHECPHCGNTKGHTVNSKYMNVRGGVRYYISCGKCGAHSVLNKMFKEE